MDKQELSRRDACLIADYGAEYLGMACYRLPGFDSLGAETGSEKGGESVLTSSF